ncbi:MAG: RnfABCDGE type electron transport complex subunit D [Ignavibacteriae bacterium]|nr:RnfABCDGE type electron transport complex subunit D [Ignavibacteria bacterium]MBI3364786.1 RnfABCDGE type electron transport complex subunit D [Ignavibacteriota bacterium]
MQPQTLTQKKIEFIIPSLRDPRITVFAANLLWIILGHEVLYFNRSSEQLVTALLACTILDVIVTFVMSRKIVVPLSGLLTGLSIGLLLASYDLRLFVVVSAWSIASKYLIKLKGQHIFNPSNFGIVAALLLTHGLASVAPGSQWGGDFRFALVIFAIGLVTMWRVQRLRIVLGWLTGYVLLGLLRMAVGQGGLIFVLGPLTGAEFALFTFVMIPDPKTTPTEKDAQVWFGLMLGILDGFMRLAEIRFSMFYALFIMCAARPLISIIREKIASTVSDEGMLRVFRLSRAKAE